MKPVDLFLIFGLLVLVWTFVGEYEGFYPVSVSTTYDLGMSTRFTRNQSYDLRGDPCVIRPNPGLSPWGISSTIPQPGVYCN